MVTTRKKRSTTASDAFKDDSTGKKAKRSGTSTETTRAESGSRM